AVDGAGMPIAAYAATSEADRRVMEAIRAMTLAELTSAERGHRPARSGAMDLVACLALRDFGTAERLVRENPALIERGRASGGALHLLSKRDDAAAVQWLLDHGADPNARWAHSDAELTALHLAAQQGHAEVLRALLVAGGDPSIRDSKHDGDAAGWAEHGRNPPASNWRQIVQMVQAHVAKGQGSRARRCSAGRCRVAVATAAAGSASDQGLSPNGSMKRSRLWVVLGCALVFAGAGAGGGGATGLAATAALPARASLTES